VAVEAGHQRQGIGTLLVQKIEGLLLEDGIRTIVADTPQQNVPARNFLEVTPNTSCQIPWGCTRWGMAVFFLV
jgi:GNAT superfamily N-acetyltransferase